MGCIFDWGQLLKAGNAGLCCSPSSPVHGLGHGRRVGGVPRGLDHGVVAGWTWVSPGAHTELQPPWLLVAQADGVRSQSGAWQWAEKTNPHGARSGAHKGGEKELPPCHVPGARPGAPQTGLQVILAAGPAAHPAPHPGSELCAVPGAHSWEGGARVQTQPSSSPHTPRGGHGAAGTHGTSEEGLPDAEGELQGPRGLGHRPEGAGRVVCAESGGQWPGRETGQSAKEG